MNFLFISQRSVAETTTRYSRASTIETINSMAETLLHHEVTVITLVTTIETLQLEGISEMIIAKEFSHVKIRA